MAQNPPTPTEFTAETEEALLGEAWKRKQRGNSGQINQNEIIALVDCAGNDELAAGVQIACEVVQVLPHSVGLNSPDGTNETPAILGILEWGNDGAATSCEFDFVNGTVISVAAASVRVRAQYEIPPAEPFPVVVRGHVGYFPKPAFPATRTLRAQLDPASEIALPIPKFARRVRVIRLPQVSASIFLSAFPSAGIGQNGPTLEAEIELPLPNDARVIVVRNNDPDVGAFFRAIFDLWI